MSDTTKESDAVKNKIVSQLKFHSISGKPIQDTINDMCSIIDDYTASLREQVKQLEGEKNKLSQCLHGLNGALDEYWNCRHRGEKEIKKITNWQQTSLKVLTPQTEGGKNLG